MAKANEEKERQKQTEERISALRNVNRGLIALDVLQNKKTEYTKAFLQSMDESDALKIKIVDEILNEISKEIMDFDEKFIMV